MKKGQCLTELLDSNVFDFELKIRRLLADSLDYYTCLLIGVLLHHCLIMWWLFPDFNLKLNNSDFLAVILTQFAFIVPFLIIKDLIFRNASLGKKLFGIKIVYTNRENNGRIDFLTHLKRNIPLLVFPIEFLLILIFNKRIGDVWAKTQVVESIRLTQCDSPVYMKTRRLLAGLLDYCVIGFVISRIVDYMSWVILNCDLSLNLNLGFMDVDLTKLAFMLPFLMFRDVIFRNASLGKKLFEIKTVYTDKENNGRIGFFTHLKRNIPLLLLPVELILIVVKNKRIGDIWAKTEVVRDKKQT